MNMPQLTAGEGFRTEHLYTITPVVYERFVAAFADANRLRIDDGFAQRRGFPERVMHGAILNGFISHFVGVHFPGDGSLLHSVRTQYKSPCHLGDQARIEASVTQVSEAVGVVTMELVLTNLTRSRVAAKAKVQVGVP